jgi:hypothetical protein
MEGFELRGGAGEKAVGRQDTPYVGEQRLRVADVLEHLLAVDEIEAVVVERDRDAVEGLEPRIAAHAAACLG